MLPIAIGQGASAELRQPPGIKVGQPVGPAVACSFITPVLYTYMEDLSRRWAGCSRPAGAVYPAAGRFQAHRLGEGPPPAAGSPAAANSRSISASSPASNASASAASAARNRSRTAAQETSIDPLQEPLDRHGRPEAPAACRAAGLAPDLDLVVELAQGEMIALGQRLHDQQLAIRGHHPRRFLAHRSLQRQRHVVQAVEEQDQVETPGRAAPALACDQRHVRGHLARARPVLLGSRPTGAAPCAAAAPRSRPAPQPTSLSPARDGLAQDVVWRRGLAAWRWPVPRSPSGTGGFAPMSARLDKHYEEIRASADRWRAAAMLMNNLDLEVAEALRSLPRRIAGRCASGLLRQDRGLPHRPGRRTGRCWSAGKSR